MLKLKFQYFGHLMLRVDSLKKTLILGGIGGIQLKQITETIITNQLSVPMHLYTSDSFRIQEKGIKEKDIRKDFKE